MARVGGLEIQLLYLKEVTVQLSDDTGNFAERRRCNFDAVKPLFVIDTAKLRPLKATCDEENNARLSVQQRRKYECEWLRT
jgi:hypothetical protein